ncbi:MAG: procyclic acidic repetitive family protein, partial [Butyrivibrio sp.]|nr:procyclic acidic repetitive family protein [Butyrivibrio sp.]
MAIADRFLEDARIGIQVEVIAGPKEITGEIVALDKETVSIHRKDNRTSTLLISSISYYEIIEEEEPAEPALGKEPSKESAVKTESEPAVKAEPVVKAEPEAKTEPEPMAKAEPEPVPKAEPEPEPAVKTEPEPVQQTAAATAASGNTPPQSLFEKQLSGVFAPSEEVYKLCLSAVDDLRYRDAIKVLSDALPDMQDKKEGCEALIQFLTEAAERAEDERIANDGTDLYKGIIISKAEMDPDKASYYLRRAVEQGGPRLKTAIYRSLVVYFKAGDVEKAADVAEELIERTRQVVPEEDQTIIWKTMLNLFSATGRQKIYEKTLFDMIHASQSHIVSCINATLKFVAPLEEEGNPETVREVYRTILDIREVQESGELLTQILARLVLFLHRKDQEKPVKELISPFLFTEEARKAYSLTIEPVLERLIETGDVSVCEINPDELPSEDNGA